MDGVELVGSLEVDVETPKKVNKLEKVVEINWQRN